MNWHTQLLILGTTRPPKMTETRTTPQSAKGNRSGFDGRFSLTRSALAVPGFDNAFSNLAGLLWPSFECSRFRSEERRVGKEWTHEWARGNSGGSEA